MKVVTDARPPLPPFTSPPPRLQKVQAAEDAWNSRDPDRVSRAYTVDSHWRNRGEHIIGRDEIVAFLTANGGANSTTPCARVCGLHGNRIAVRFQYECHDAAGQWWRSYGNELWEFDATA